MTEKEQAAREAELARREAALAAREAQLEQEQAQLEAARAEGTEGRKTLLNNNDPNFVNPKEKLYDKFPLTVHQMDIIIGVLFALIVLFLVLGTSTTTTFVESASGVTEGGRTGLTSMTTGVLFLLAVVFSPLFLTIPSFATAPALIIVGFYMMGSAIKIDFSDPSEGWPDRR